MDTFALISLILSLMMLAFVIIGVLYGLIVGFKKSLISGIYNLVLVIILIIITSSLTTIVLQYDITKFNLQANGSVCKTLGDYIVAMIESNPEISNAISSNPELKDVILTLPSLIASPFIFVVLFWLVKIIVFIISLPVNLIIFLCTKNKRKKNVDTRGNVIKPKKRRLLGMACGFVIGLIAIFATMVPIYGLGSAIMKLDSIKMNGSTASLMLYAESGNTTEEQSLLSALVGDETSKKIVSAYKGNVGINITRIIGMEAIGTHAFNSLTRTKINNTEVKLLDDITTVLNVYNDVLNIKSYIEKETLTKEEMTELLTKTDNTINKVFEVKFLTAVGNTVFPIVVDKMLNDDPNFPIKLPDEIKNDEVKEFIVKQALQTLTEYDFSFVKSILQDLTSILKLTNDNNILTPVYNSIKTGTQLTNKDYVNLIKSTDDNFAKSLSDKITNITFIKDLSPSLIDSAFESLFKSLGLTYSTNNITKDKASQVICNLIQYSINGLKTVNLDSNLVVTKNTLPFVGKLLDTLKDTEVLNSNQYIDLIDVAKTKAKENTNGLPVNLNNVIDNLSDVNVWEDELLKISNAFEEIEYIAEIIKSSNLEIDKLDLQKVGKMFDKLELTTLFENEIRPIYNDMLETSKTSLSVYSTALEILKITDPDLSDASLTKVEWEKELTSIQPLIKELLKFKDLDLSGSDKENAEKLINLCNKFDEVEQNPNSKIYSKKMQPLLIEAMTVAKNQDAQNADLYENIILRLNNRKSSETLTDCVEKGALTYAINSAIKDVTTEHGIKDALTDSKDFIIENNTISKLFESLDKINSEIESLKTMNAKDIQSIDINRLSTSLNAIKNTGSFPVMFTNKILSNILSEVDYSSVPEGQIKTDIENYIQTKKSFLENETSEINDNTYSEILTGLKNLLPTA